MFDAAEFRALVSGRRRGLPALAARAVLRCAELPYACAVQARNRLYEAGCREVVQFQRPVISVGNLTLGGTGKTPLVAWLAGWLRQRMLRVAIVSRGYRAGADGVNDEALELEQRLPDVPHLQNRDRVAAARIAFDELDMQVIVLDDGFQHRRLARDLDLVLVDATEPFGFGHVFPRGLLREPSRALARADVVALSRSDLVAPARRDEIRRAVLGHAPQVLWLETRHAPEALRGAGGECRPLLELAGRRIAAFAGIGNPEGFRRTLAGCNYEVAAWRELPDHYRYARRDIEDLGAWVAGQDVAAAVCTHKDLVKIRLDELGGKPLWALTVGIEIDCGREELEAMLTALMPRDPAG